MLNSQKKLECFLHALERSDSSIDAREKEKIVRYVQENGVEMIPYAFKESYSPKDVEIRTDAETGKRYALFRGKKMFFPQNRTNRRMKNYFNDLFLEQDERSPHAYTPRDYPISYKGRVIADVGAAEGIFALSVIEECKYAYLFECDHEWIEALRCTFAPWKEKVMIVEKFVGREGDPEAQTITLDSFFDGKEVDFIKADIEGAEMDMLSGANRILEEKITALAVCAYHEKEHEQSIRELLGKKGFQTTTTSGYMIDAWAECPSLVRGVVLAQKQSA